MQCTVQYNFCVNLIFVSGHNLSCRTVNLREHFFLAIAIQIYIFLIIFCQLGVPGIQISHSFLDKLLCLKDPRDETKISRESNCFPRQRMLSGQFTQYSRHRQHIRTRRYRNLNKIQRYLNIIFIRRCLYLYQTQIYLIRQ